MIISIFDRKNGKAAPLSKGARRDSKERNLVVNFTRDFKRCEQCLRGAGVSHVYILLTPILGSSIFRTLKDYFRQNILPINYINIIAPTMDSLNIYYKYDIPGGCQTFSSFIFDCIFLFIPMTFNYSMSLELQSYFFLISY